ncbi:hypothetical protein GCM10028818_60210 [Spirosoma horti]
MQSFIALVKALGTGILILLSIPVLFLVLVFLPEFCTKRIDSTSLIQSQSFQDLHHMITQLDSTKNIAVLTKSEFVVVDGLVINLAKRTFGSEPVLGFYQSYYDEGSKHKYSSLDSLLAPRHLDSTTVYRITAAMKTTNIADVEINYKVIIYRWKVSAMYREEGILYGEWDMTNNSQYKLFESIAPHFYHFAH